MSEPPTDAVVPESINGHVAQDKPPQVDPPKDGKESSNVPLPPINPYLAEFQKEVDKQRQIEQQIMSEFQRQAQTLSHRVNITLERDKAQVQSLEAYCQYLDASRQLGSAKIAMESQK